MLLPVCALFASCLKNLIQLLHHHRYIDFCAFGEHLGLFLVDYMQHVTKILTFCSFTYVVVLL